jgi:membrane fusion protein, multidrug efflux system
MNRTPAVSLIRALSLLSTVFMLIGSMIACSGKSENADAGKQPPVPVVVSKVLQKDMPVQIKAVGSVEAFSTVTIKPQVGGVLQEVHFSEGQDVHKGDLLFTIDPRPFQSQVVQAQANLERDKAQAQNARAVATRYEGLVKKDFVTAEQYDSMRTNADALEASVKAEEAAVENARLLLNYCTIRAPLDGRTGNLIVHPGNVMKENETEMLSINQVRPIYVRFSVPGEQLAEVTRYNRGNLKVLAVSNQQGDKPVEGVLSFIDNGVDQSTGTILLKGTFQNPDGSLWPGEFVNVVLTLTTLANATVVPSQAVETGQQGQFVFVIKQDMTAEQRPVVPGLSVNQETVINQGLNPGETVVTDGQLRLLPGAKVEIKGGQSKTSQAEKSRENPKSSASLEPNSSSVSASR